MFQQQIYILCVLLALVAAVASQGSIQYFNRKHPTLENHCYHDMHKLSVKVHETVYPTNVDYQCLKATCSEDYTMDIAYCPRGQPTCGKKPDYSKPFPECCSDC
ncbi:uncharacterized protein LOC106084116 [Stomoxys calcitrans]|uniref:Single domain-containing protein n=1 Tax=Stomoxys calcitrans TaxID=35570 RepID=A0A1I8P2B3_STOCA|nr:uncharacterized protein LOC106084116 [Stomoxys calcitrans]